MIRVIVADGRAENEFLLELERRSGETNRAVTAQVNEILTQVREKGDEALQNYNEKFDQCFLETLLVRPDELRRAYERCPQELIQALEAAKFNIEDFHRRQKQQTWMNAREDGVFLGQRIQGLRRVGVYVPGGTAAYPSSVLMNVIPAKVAGVEEILMATPAKGGKIADNILAAAYIAGIDRVYAMGGAQAIAALAYGTQSVPKVDKIVGPGNIYVATAKRQLYGVVDIDMIAGPSEILVVADKTADPTYVAADLMSQAEHDVLASAILLTDCPDLPDRVNRELEGQMAALSRKEIIAQSLNRFGAAVVCKSLEQMAELANRLAPEHLELMLDRPLEKMTLFRNAGSVFLGKYAPEPLGDYYAGPNHVLPTGGTARFFSPLSVDSFVKKSSFIYYTEDALAAAREDITIIARSEGLTAHANAIDVRFR